jgi:cell division transport system permease protein
LSKEVKYKKRTSFWPTIISMSLVLFIVGLLGLVSIYANHLSSFYQKNFEVFVFFAADADDEIALNVQKQINSLPFVNKTTFVDREVAARKEIARTGEDFIKTLGYNPIPHSLQININSEFADEQKMEVVEKQLRFIPQVDDVVFAKDDLGKNILSQINKNFNTIKTILMALAGVLLFISLILINSTVRINMFARRFIIKSMQYVGASDWFIIKPFIKMYLIYALVSTLIALGLLFSLVYVAETNLQFNNWQLFIQQYLLLSSVLLGLAVVISLVSVYFSTKRYLKLKIDQLY